MTPATKALSPITLDKRGTIVAINVWVLYTSNMPKAVAVTMAAAAASTIKKGLRSLGVGKLAAVVTLVS